MVLTALALAFASCAALDDLRNKTIRNVTTYSGTAIAIAFNSLGSLWEQSTAGAAWTTRLGWLGMPDSLLGLLACGFLMLLAYVFFQIGGGDVKLIAMLGAFLGLEQGIETMLWTLVLGAAVALTVLIFKLGVGQLVILAISQLRQALKLGTATELSPELKEALRPDLHLAPCAVAALCIVRIIPV